MYYFLGDIEIHEWTMERVIEALESQCHENMEIKKKTEEGLGIEYDEDIVCEICQSVSATPQPFLHKFNTYEKVMCFSCFINCNILQVASPSKCTLE